jgi:hypothetical protein
MAQRVQERGPVVGSELAAGLLLEDLQADGVEGVVLPLGVLLSVLTRTRPMSAIEECPPFIKRAARGSRTLPENERQDERSGETRRPARTRSGGVHQTVVR